MITTTATPTIITTMITTGTITSTTERIDRLKDKIVLITGAAGAIGRRWPRRSGKAARAITGDLPGRKGADHALDVTAEPDWLRVIAEIGRTHGQLDGLVNAAGLAALGNIENTDFATWRKILAVNLDGTFSAASMLALLSSAAARSSISRRSPADRRANLAAYNASKGGVRLLTKSVALHGARLDPQVRCNSVHPAFLEGQMVDKILKQTSFPDAARARITRDIPLGRLGTAAEVAEMCVYLLSENPASSPARNSSSTAV